MTINLGDTRLLDAPRVGDWVKNVWDYCLSDTEEEIFTDKRQL